MLYVRTHALKKVFDAKQNIKVHLTWSNTTPSFSSFKIRGHGRTLCSSKLPREKGGKP